MPPSVPSPQPEAVIDQVTRALAAKLPYRVLTDEEVESATGALRQLELFKPVTGLWVAGGGLLGTADTRRSRASRPRYLGVVVEGNRTEWDPTWAEASVDFREPYQVVQVELPAPLGDVFIRPETLGDKLAELFSAREVDFADHRAFSRAYYVLASDEDRLRANVPASVLDAFARRRGLFAEIRSRTLTVMRFRPADEADALDLAELAVEISPV